MSASIVVSAENHERAADYVAALAAVGVAAEDVVVVVPDRPHPDARRLGAQAAGLVLAGGEDIDPRHYGEAAIPEANNDVVEARDRLEFDLLAGADAESVPVWGICRGMQVINVHLGGSLYQDIPLQVSSGITHLLSRPWDALIHTVGLARLSESTEHAELSQAQRRLVEILNREPAQVNSRHHQAVKRLGRDLSPVAHSADGLLEAMSGTRPDWWLNAVQWHPENLIDLPQQRALWQSFVAATERRMIARPSASGDL